jgi:hypothetical protein
MQSIIKPKKPKGDAWVTEGIKNIDGARIKEKIEDHLLGQINNWIHENIEQRLISSAGKPIYIWEQEVNSLARKIKKSRLEIYGELMKLGFDVEQFAASCSFYSDFSHHDVNTGKGVPIKISLSESAQ